MEWNADFIKEEVREGFLITEKRKKVWAVELNLLEEFKKVCQRYDLRWYADFGTLLGAIRHRGFIPWDDDIDISMPRPDYNILVREAGREFSEPICFQNIYNCPYATCFSKLRDSRTTAIEFPNIDMNQGIFLDIFPMDDEPDGSSPELDKIYQIKYELWCTIVSSTEIMQAAERGETILQPDIIRDLLNMRYDERMWELEEFCESHFEESKKCNFLTDGFLGIATGAEWEWFKKTEVKTFEDTQMIVPAEYNKILEFRYGDWKKYVQGTAVHSNIILDPDLPYQHYLHKD